MSDTQAQAEDRQAQIEDRLELATRGPWRLSMTGYSVKSSDDDMLIVANNPWGAAMNEKQCGPWIDNAVFIAHAREDVPWLLSRLSRVEQTCAEMNALFHAVMEVAEGRKVSDFMESFGAVRMVRDMRAELSRLSRAEQALRAALVEAREAVVEQDWPARLERVDAALSASPEAQPKEWR